MCPEVDSASKIEYQEIPGGKDGRCIRVTTLPASYCRKSRKFVALIYWIPKGLLRPAAGKIYLQQQNEYFAAGVVGYKQKNVRGSAVSEVTPQ
jgi:hypothetical protein